MEHPEVHGEIRHLPRQAEEHASAPIFVPAGRSPVKLVRRGLRQRRRLQAAAVLLVVLLVGAFSYAFVVEHNLEQTLRRQAP